MTTLPEILAAIADCETKKQLMRIDHDIIPAALITNEERLQADRAVEAKLSELNRGGAR
ncbi:MAG TPA: hypothetical protein VN516_00095 [Candidatus Baltobacteraceae bacterium]|nr:hypothetical protein [Candidatus Baltobacteraceae bacterium]